MSTAAASIFHQLSRSEPRGDSIQVRAWQADGLTQYLSSTPRDFLAACYPGGWQATYALGLRPNCRHGLISRVTVVAPAEHLKTQWADAGPPGVGIRITRIHQCGRAPRARSSTVSP